MGPVRVATHDVAGLWLPHGKDVPSSRSQVQLRHEKRRSGDPCVNTREYYQGPEFPKALAARIHPLATDVRLDFEHGDLRTVAVTLKGKFSESDVLKAFDLADDRGRPPNIMSVSVQDCSLVGTCLLLIGFDHMGAGDVDCSNRPRR